MKHRISFILGVVLGIALLATQVGVGLAQTTGSIEIHKRVCPAGTIGNVFDECHGNVPEQPVAFSVDGGAAQFVDSAGNVVFDDLDAGTHAISETEGIPLEFVTLVVYCTVLDDTPEAIQVATDGPNFSVAVGAGESVVCDVYNIPEDLSGLTPTPAAGPTSTPSVTLPNTGSGWSDGQGSPIPGSLFAILLLLGVATIVVVTRRIGRDPASRSNE